jgi:hypothetical protein
MKYLLLAAAAIAALTLVGRSLRSQDSRSCLSTFDQITGQLLMRGPSVRCYELTAGSPFKHAGTDGKDVGADVAAVDAATCGVIEGRPCVPGAPPPNTPKGLRVVEGH